MHPSPKRRKVSVFILFAVLLLCISGLWPPSPGLAILALPEIGINYQTMKVSEAAKLIAAGMKDVRTGDGISLGPSPEGKLLFKNLRTREELVYPPARPREK